MRAVLTNVGIRGDAQPFLTLTVELRQHNHRPVLALAPEWRQRVGALDLEFVARAAWTDRHAQRDGHRFNRAR